MNKSLVYMAVLSWVIFSIFLKLGTVCELYLLFLTIMKVFFCILVKGFKVDSKPQDHAGKQ